MPSLKSGLASFCAFSLLLLQLSSTEARRLPTNPQWVKLHALRSQSTSDSLAKRQGATFPVFTFTQPLDHFVDTGFTFEQRYWLSDRHYKPGGPVIVFEAGEGPATSACPSSTPASSTYSLTPLTASASYLNTGITVRRVSLRVTGPDRSRLIPRGVRARAEFHHGFIEVQPFARTRALLFFHAMVTR